MRLIDRARSTLIGKVRVQHDHGGGLFGPDGIEITSRSLRVGQGFAASFAITGYPAEVGAGWLEPLLCYPGRLDVSVHVEPTPPLVAADRLRRQLARLESGRRATVEKGRLDRPEIDAAAEDAWEMATNLARGRTRLFRAGLYLTVHAGSVEELESEVARVRAVAGSLLLSPQQVTFRQLQGWVTTLPVGVDVLDQRRTMDTDALGAGFPFTSPDLPNTDIGGHANPTGVLYGTNTTSGGLVVWDRWTQDNHNTVVLARSGAGKSYLVKLDLLRSLYQGVRAAVIDPEHEYHRVCEAVGGAYVRLGAPEVCLNPFDLPVHPGPDALTHRALAIHTLVALMLDQPVPPDARAALDRAITTAYTTVGISADPRTWTRPAPLLADLDRCLREDPDPTAHGLADRLAPFITGTWKGLFSGATTTRPDSHLVVYSLRDLPDELKPLGTFLAVDAIWQQVTTGPRHKRLIVVDEAWSLMRVNAGALFLYRLAKSARKHWAGLTVVTQDAADVLGSDLGQAVVSNAATQILLRQAPQVADQITEAFGLSDGERAYLLSAGRGDGLLCAGTNRVGFHALAAPGEHRLITTNPGELDDELIA